MGSPFSPTYHGTAYVVAAGVGCAVAAKLHADRQCAALVASLAADIASTLTVYGFSVGANNSSVYDAYWVAAPLPLAAYWLSLNPKPSARAWAALGLVGLWTARYLSIEDPSSKVSHEDWRYADFRQKLGRAYWPFSLLSFHLTPTLVVFLCASPLYPLLSADTSLGASASALLQPYISSHNLFAAGALVSLGGLALQTAADQQLHVFRQAQRQCRAQGRDGEEGAVLEHGVWAYSRHPNYFGELLFWAGALGMGLSAGLPHWLCGGAAVLALFLRGGSVPLMDQRMLQRRPQYAATMRRVSAFMPWPPSK